VSIVLVTTRETLDRDPATATKVADAMVAGIDRTVKAPASAVTAARAFIPTLDQAGGEAAAAATLEATIPLWKTPEGTVSGKMDPQAWEAMTAFMLEKGLIATAVDPAEAMDNDIVTA